MTQRHRRKKLTQTAIDNHTADEFQAYHDTVNALRRLEEWVEQMNAREIAHLILRLKEKDADR